MTDKEIHGMMSSVVVGDPSQPFDQRFLDQMIVHHQGAVMPAQMVIADSARPEGVRVATDQRIRLIDFVWASFAFVLHSVFMTRIAQNLGRTHAGPRTLPAGEVSFSASPSRIYIYTLSFNRTSWSIATERP